MKLLARFGRAVACLMLCIGIAGATSTQRAVMSRLNGMTLPSGSDVVSSMVTDIDFIYAASGGKISKIRNTDVHDFGIMDLTTTNPDFAISALTESGDYVYAGGTTAALQGTKYIVMAISKITMLVTHSKEYTGTSGPHAMLAGDNSDLYLGLGSSPAILVKVDMATLMPLNSLTFNGGENDLRSLAWETSASTTGSLFAVCNVHPAVIVQVSTSTMSRTSALPLLVGENGALAAVQQDDTHLFVVTHTTPTKVVQILKGTGGLTRVGAMTLNTGDDLGTSAVSDSEYIFIGTTTSPAKIVRVEKSNIVALHPVSTSIEFHYGENNVGAMVASGDEIWAGLATFPGKVIEVGGFKSPINCHASYGDWSGCTATCGPSGTKSRSTTIHAQPMFGGSACPTPTELEPCNGDVVCPTQCMWGAKWTTKGSLPVLTCSNFLLGYSANTNNEQHCQCPPSKPILSQGMCVPESFCAAGVLKPCGEIEADMKFTSCPDLVAGTTTVADQEACCQKCKDNDCKHWIFDTTSSICIVAADTCTGKVAQSNSVLGSMNGAMDFTQGASLTNTECKFITCEIDATSRRIQITRNSSFVGNLASPFHCQHSGSMADDGCKCMCSSPM